MSSFWSFYIVLLVSINLVGCSILLYLTQSYHISDEEKKKVSSKIYDGITEYNNPLPRWWIYLFWGTIFFAIYYLFMYPGLGSYKGYLNWTSKKQWQEEVDEAKKHYEPIYSKYLLLDIPNLSKDEKALKIGRRLFLNNCSVCHGIDARGAVGFPNLSDEVFRWGNNPNLILHTITNGRKALMPPFNKLLNDDEINSLSSYVMSISNKKYDETHIKDGDIKFKKMCSVCHGVSAKGNIALGAPDITRGVWIYGTSFNSLKETIKNGRNGVMPSFKDILSKEQIYLLAAYIYDLSVNNKN